MKHGILSTRTAFVGVERDGPVSNISQAKTRLVPIQLSKDSQQSYDSLIMSYAPYASTNDIAESSDEGLVNIIQKL